MNKNLLKTNLLIALILLAGFALTAWLGNRASYRSSIVSLEQVTTLTADSIYYQLSQLLNKPVNVVLTMAHDTLLVRHLRQQYEHRDELEYVEAIKNYLEAYHKEYDFDSVFLISTKTGNYYTYNGFDRVITKENKADSWYYDFLDTGREYELNIDNNKERGANNAITVFINSRVLDSAGQVVGVIGIGIKVDYLRDIITKYEKEYGVDVFFINEQGRIEVSSLHTGDEGRSLFNFFDIENMAQDVLDRRNQDVNFGFWATSARQDNDSIYIVTRYMPTLSWYVAIAHNTQKIISNIRSHVIKSLLVIFALIACIVFIVSLLIRKFNNNIEKIIDQRHELFKKATEVLYEDIFEWNIGKNTYGDKTTCKYMEDLGVKNMTYDNAIKAIAEKQLGVEYRNHYLAKFNRKNIIDKFNQGITNLQYDMEATRDGKTYHWLRIDGHIFYSPEDQAVHMFTYRKNIDVEKRKEFLANIDEMTGCYTKKATERMIEEDIAKNANGLKAFFILDIDNFKQANDHYGHAFGDLCIRRFAATIKSHFRENDIVGRLGGDEFAVFITIPNITWLRDRANELSRALNFVCRDGDKSWLVSASIGVAIYPENGVSFSQLYRKADESLYRTKQQGKNGVNFAA